MSVLGLREWFKTSAGGLSTTGPTVPKAIILDEPGEFPQYGEHCFATYWLDPHGFKLEAVCHSPDDPAVTAASRR
jgi:hypothetical protein